MRVSDLTIFLVMLSLLLKIRVLLPFLLQAIRNLIDYLFSSSLSSGLETGGLDLSSGWKK